MKLCVLALLIALAAACARKTSGPQDETGVVAIAIGSLSSERRWTCWQSVHTFDEEAGANRHYVVGRTGAGSGMDPFEIVVSKSCDSAGKNCAFSAAARPIGQGETSLVLDVSKC